MKNFFKFLLIGILSVIIVIGIGLFIFIKTVDVKRFKPQIVSASQKTLNRSVDFSDIALKISSKTGLTLNLTNFVIGEHPDFGTDNFLSAKELILRVSIKDIIFKKQIRVLNVQIQSPKLSIIRLKDGRINVETFAALQKNNAQSASMAVPALFINQLNVTDAQVRYVDYLFTPALSLNFHQIKFTAADISLTKPFSIIVSAAFFSKTPNIYLSGKGEINLSRASFLLKDAHADFDLASLSMEELQEALPRLKQSPLFNVNSGKLTAVIKLFEAGQAGLSLAMDAELRGGGISLPKIGEGVSLTLRHIDLAVKDFSLNNEFPFELSFAYLNDSPNIAVQGKGLIHLDSQTFEITETIVNADLSTLSLTKLKNSMAALGDVYLPEDIKGKLAVNIDKLAAGADGLSQLKAEGSISGGLLRMKEFAAPVNSIEAKFMMSESLIMLESVSALLGKGRIELSGSVNDYLTKQVFLVNAEAVGLDIAECLNQQNFPVKTEGVIFGNFKFHGQGFNPDLFIKNLGGSSAIEIKEGNISGINILKAVLDKLSFIPNLSGILQANLPDNFKDKLSREDTVVTTFGVNANMENSILYIEQMNMSADGFRFDGKGKLNLDASYAFDGTFAIPEDLSSLIIKNVSQMDILLNEAKQISFPLKVSGKGTKVVFYPDIKSIGIDAIKGKVQEELEKFLDKILDKN